MGRENGCHILSLILTNELVDIQIYFSKGKKIWWQVMRGTFLTRIYLFILRKGMSSQIFPQNLTYILLSWEQFGLKITYSKQPCRLKKKVWNRNEIQESDALFLLAKY